jgi:hypothetical protein
MQITPRSTNPIYLKKKDLLSALAESREAGQMNDRLAKMFQMLVSKYSTKGCFVNYSYIDDMRSYALLMLVRTWKSFDPEKSNNPFAFFTQCVKNSFIQYLNQEKKQRVVRDLLLVDRGLTPSYGFQDEYNTDTHFVEDEQDFYYTEQANEALQSYLTTDDTDTTGSPQYYKNITDC